MLNKFVSKINLNTLRYFSNAQHINMIPKHSTTILAIKKANEIVIIGDGQVTQGHTVKKVDVKKVRYIKDDIVCGFAGSASDAFTLMESLEKEINKYEGFPLIKPCIELAKRWRNDKNMRHLEATIIVCTKDTVIFLFKNIGY